MSNRKTKTYSRPRHYRSWTESEEQALSRGVSVHGVGSWESIRKDPTLAVLKDRTGVQLKDKWRNMVKFKHVSLLHSSAAEGKKAATSERCASPEQSHEQDSSMKQAEHHTSSTEDAPVEMQQSMEGSVRSGGPRNRRSRYRRVITSLEDKRFGIYDVRRYMNKNSGSSGSMGGLLSAACEEAESEDAKRMEGTEGQVECLCGVTIDDGAMMVECEQCLVWSHVQCLQALHIAQPEFLFDMEHYTCASCQGLLIDTPMASGCRSKTTEGSFSYDDALVQGVPRDASVHSMENVVQQHGSVQSFSAMDADPTVRHMGSSLAQSSEQGPSGPLAGTPLCPIDGAPIPKEDRTLSPFALPPLSPIPSPLLGPAGAGPLEGPPGGSISSIPALDYAGEDIMECIANYSMDPESKVHGGSLAAFALAASSLDVPSDDSHLLEHAMSCAQGTSGSSLDAPSMDILMMHSFTNGEDDDASLARMVAEQLPTNATFGEFEAEQQQGTWGAASTAAAPPTNAPIAVPRNGCAEGSFGGPWGSMAGPLTASLQPCTSPPASTSFASSADVTLTNTPTSQYSQRTAASLPSPSSFPGALSGAPQGRVAGKPPLPWGVQRQFVENGVVLKSQQYFMMATQMLQQVDLMPGSAPAPFDGMLAQVHSGGSSPASQSPEEYNLAEVDDQEPIDPMLPSLDDMLFDEDFQLPC